jgi:hypothetical protein
MEATDSFTLTARTVSKIVNTTVAGPYLVTYAGAARRAHAARAIGTASAKLGRFQSEVSDPCIVAASVVERVLDQHGMCADRIVRSREGGIGFIFFAGPRYAMLEIDDEGTTVALLSDRSIDAEAETWVVEADGLTNALRKIESFLTATHAAVR